MSDTPQERRPFDTSLQGLAALYSQHFLAWLRGTDVIWLQSLDTVMTAIQRRADFLIRYQRAGLEQLLHIEFQNQVRGADKYLTGLPMRMATYGILTRNRYGQVPQQVLVLIHESEAARAVPSFYQEEGIRVDYQVVRLWEVDPAPLLASGLLGLLPLVPLTRGAMEPLLSQSLTALRQGVKSNQEYGELVGVTALLATLRFKREDVREFFRRRETMSLLTETPLFEELFQEVMQERLLVAEQQMQAQLLQAEQQMQAQLLQAEQQMQAQLLQAEQRVQAEAELRVQAAMNQQIEAELRVQAAMNQQVEAEQRVERLAARLRALGIDLDVG